MHILSQQLNAYITDKNICFLAQDVQIIYAYNVEIRYDETHISLKTGTMKCVFCWQQTKLNAKYVDNRNNQLLITMYATSLIGNLWVKYGDTDLLAECAVLRSDCVVWSYTFI